MLAICLVVGSARALAVEADGAALIEYESGRVLFGQDMDERLPMASTTKIMTALLTLEQSGLDLPFKVDDRAIMVEGSSMGLQKGDTVTLRTLAAGMLLASGNDAANAAAVRVSGSVGAFVVKMNQRAHELGLANTSFETPSGLDGEGHYSSAYDMAILARAALKNADFAELCSKTSMALEYGNPPYRRWLSNHNRLLECCEGAVGVKTGFTKKAGRCLVSAVRRDGTTLIFVTLDCPDDWDAHMAVYDEYFSRLTKTELSECAQAAEIAVEGGIKNSVPVSPDEVYAGLLEEERGRVTVDYELAETLMAPVNAGDRVGTATFRLDGAVIATTGVTARGNVLALPKKESWIDGIIKFFERTVMK